MTARVISVDGKCRNVVLDVDKSVVIGRGPLFEILEKNISRNHATIKLKQNGRVLLRSTHTNPCFIYTTTKAELLLSQDQERYLINGEQFSLLENKQFLFEVEIKTHLSNGTTGASTSTDRKRVLPKWLLQLPAPSANESKDKKPKTEKPTGTFKPKLDRSIIFDSDDDDAPDDSNKNAPDPDDDIVMRRKVDDPVWKSIGSRGDSTTDSPTYRVSPVPAQTSRDDDDSGGAVTRVVRRQCKYGGGCYRANPDHRREFSHPGDDDYDVPSTSRGVNGAAQGDAEDDNRPECQFGALCYRKNPDHRREFKHTAKPPRKSASEAKDA